MCAPTSISHLDGRKGKGEDVSLCDGFLEQQAGYPGPLERWVAVVVDERYSAVVDVQISLISMRFE
jgi:hypothetical protein